MNLSTTRRVVNCSQILYLCRPETTILPRNRIFRSCELLSNFVSLSSWNNTDTTKPLTVRLWIALKFCIFVVLKQPKVLRNSVLSVVNCSQILYLCRPETTAAIPLGNLLSCELLSNFVSLSSWNNFILYINEFMELWIALKFCIFVVLKQLMLEIRVAPARCELLSNFVSLSSWNNEAQWEFAARGVVNCSQILYLCRPETTVGRP